MWTGTYKKIHLLPASGVSNKIEKDEDAKRSFVNVYALPGRLFEVTGKNVIFNSISILYTILNSKTNFNWLNKVIEALTSLGNSRGFTGILNISNAVADVAQTFSTILQGVEYKVSKEQQYQSLLSSFEVSTRLQESIDELNLRQASTNDFLKKIICHFLSIRGAVLSRKDKCSEFNLGAIRRK